MAGPLGIRVMLMATLLIMWLTFLRKLVSMTLMSIGECTYLRAILDVTPEIFLSANMTRVEYMTLVLMLLFVVTFTLKSILDTYLLTVIGLWLVPGGLLSSLAWLRPGRAARWPTRAAPPTPLAAG